MRISDWSSDVCSSDLSKVSPRKSSNSLEDAGPRAYIEGGGYCPARAFAKIPEAIHHPRGLSLPGPWSDAHGPHLTLLASRSEERRVGKECVSTCRSRWSPYH